MKTKNRLAAWIGCAALALFGAQACSDDEKPNNNKDAGVEASVPDTGVTPDTGPNPDKGPGDDGATPVPPEKLVREKSTCPATYQGTAPKAGQNDSFEVAGQQRGFFLRLPESSFAGPRPLLVYFHGTDGSGDEMADFAFADELIKRGFIAVGADGVDNGSVWPTWDAMRQDGDEARENLDLAYFDALVDCLAAHHEVDAKRVYVAGHSAGGIMANRVLRERSALLAGGIPASGVFDLTDPATPGELDEMAVLVTWGGDNDEWGGTSASGKELPSLNFVEQAAIASQHYEDAAKVNQMYCKGDDLGHKWLEQINTVLVDFLEAHPKGAALSAGWAIPKTPDPKVTCSEDAATYTSPVEVTCTAQTTPDCQSYCQALGDCAVENATVRPVLAPQLKTIGFTGDDLSDCAGCVTKCETDVTAGGATDATVLACMKTETAKGTCTAGVTGFTPLVDAVNLCCKDQLGSEVCSTLCEAILENNIATAFFPTCDAWKP